LVLSIKTNAQKDQVKNEKEYQHRIKILLNYWKLKLLAKFGLKKVFTGL